MEKNNWNCHMDCKNDPDCKCAVEFTYEAAYRRDFKWASSFREQYWSIATDDWADFACNYTDAPCARTDDGANLFSLNNFQNVDYFQEAFNYLGQSRLKFAVRSSASPRTLCRGLRSFQLCCG